MVNSRIRRLRVRVGSAAVLLSVAVVLVMPQHVFAVLVGVTPGSPADTSMSPALYGPGWTEGDPGWANAARTGTSLNAVYLGDGWVLSAKHTGLTTVQFVVNGPTYTPIPNQNFIVPNTMSVPDLTNPNADLQLYRINGDPGLASLTIASQPLALNDEVMFVSYGQIRDSAESHWTTSAATNPPTWTEVGSCSGSNCMGGYKHIGGGNKRWGTNGIANDSILGGTDASDSDITTVVSHGTIAYLTTFDQFSSNPFEAQIVGGDSGSAVYHKRNGQWELAGISIANYIFAGQSYKYTGPLPRPANVPQEDFNTGNAYAIYGNASAFADLSSYHDSITAILTAHADYSVVGDLNLDGIVDDSDVSIFVANWGRNDGAASITSWTHGDLTHDGNTDINDFFRWRNELSGSASEAALSSLLGLTGGNAVPEPATILLGFVPAICIALGHRNRRKRCPD